MDRYRKCDIICELFKHIKAGFSLTETALLGKYNQVAKLNHQEMDIIYGLLDQKTPPDIKYQLVPVMESDIYLHAHILGPLDIER